MDDEVGERIRHVLLALADLSPTAEQGEPGASVPLEWFRWLPLAALALFDTSLLAAPLVRGGPLSFFDGASSTRVAAIERGFAERLAAVDQLRPSQRSLRVGWLFVAGQTVDGAGKVRRTFHPLVTIPVRVLGTGPLGDARLVAAGDVELTPLVTDLTVRDRLEGGIQLGGGGFATEDVAANPLVLARMPRLAGFARQTAAAAGWPASRLVPAGEAPSRLLRLDELVIVAGAAVYATHETGGTSRAASLEAWAGRDHAEVTALHAIYLDEEPVDARARRPLASPRRVGGSRHAVVSPFLLTPRQRAAVRAARKNSVTVISGAPGTGKSHTIGAIVHDALANDERVLVAAKSDATVDALVELLQRAPGPDPVVFGSSERRDALATRLAGGQLHGVSDDSIAWARQLLDAAVAERDRRWSEIAADLRAEQAVTVGTGDPALRDRMPALFDPGADLEHVAMLVRRLQGPGTGLGSRWRRRRARSELAAYVGSTSTSYPEELRAGLELAEAARDALLLRAHGGLEISLRWEQLAQSEDEVRRLAGRWLALHCRSSANVDRAATAAVAALATALRSGRAVRRSLLGRMKDASLTRALPLWIGTLSDIDDLLPPVPGLFDLVILDEASSIDQPLAATALLRARRAVIVGDPRQLRHVSFLSDARIDDVLATRLPESSPQVRARLDVRRNSSFDAAAAVTPVIALDEHFRSDPHLFDHVASRIYRAEVHVATRTPITAARDCVHVTPVEGTRVDGVVDAEVRAVMAHLARLQRAGDNSVGVVTPFRAQADALEAAVLDRFSADEIAALGLRVGTVHGFQGIERDTIIVSLGVGTGGSPVTWRFVEDPHLFTVLVTRARRSITVVFAGTPPPGGTLASYLAGADSPPGPPAPAGPVGSWVASIGDDIVRAGVPALASYPSGRHIVDLCVGEGSRFFGVELTVHPDGPDAHIERHLALRRAGWELMEGHHSRWGDRRGELVVELVQAARSHSTSR
ncbi:MAG: ATP-binding protein [Actinomycetota bacterium]|nr:ATP-binding protein [Actinomycetota bacterium]